MSNSSTPNPQKITFTANGKQISLKSEATFDEVFDNAYGVSGKFETHTWIINQKSQQVNKNQKIKDIIVSGSIITIQKNSVPYNNTQNLAPNQKFSSNQQQSYTQVYQPTVPNFVQSPLPNSAQPTSPFIQQLTPPSIGQPTSPFIQQPTLPNFTQPNFNPFEKPVKPDFPKPKQPVGNIDDKTGDKLIEKLINNFHVTITDWGKKVIIQSKDEDFKAVLLEENAKEANQGSIMFHESEVVSSPDEQLKLPLGKFKDKSTKVVFLRNYNGIAVAWTNGLKTKFQFQLD